MRKTARTFALAGLALVAGATIGAGPAQAAASTPTAAVKPAQTHAQDDRGRDQFVRYYRSRQACNWAGRRGQYLHQWRSFDCEPRRRGFRVLWALEVERRWSWNNNDNRWYDDDRFDNRHRFDDRNRHNH